MKPEEKNRAELFELKKDLLMLRVLVKTGSKKDINRVAVCIQDLRIREVVLAKNNSKVEDVLMMIDLMLIDVNAEIEKLSQGKK